MKNIEIYNVEELTNNQQKCLNGGGPILDGVSWFFQTMGSHTHGFFDGLLGKPYKH